MVYGIKGPGGDSKSQIKKYLKFPQKNILNRAIFRPSGKESKE